MPDFLDTLKEQDPQTEATLKYGEELENKIYIVPGTPPASGPLHFALIEIMYQPTSNPNFNFLGGQTEGLYGEENNPLDYTIPNPWIVTAGTKRLIISSYNLQGWPHGEPETGNYLCSYNAGMNEFITSAKMVTWEGTQFNLSINYNGEGGGNSVNPPKGEKMISNDDQLLSDSSSLPIGEIAPPSQMQTYSQQTNNQTLSSPGIRLKNQMFFNKLKRNFKAKSNQGRRVGGVKGNTNKAGISKRKDGGY